MLVSIYRYNPETDSKPRMQDFEVDLPAGKDMMVLDVLELMLPHGDPAVLRRAIDEHFGHPAHLPRTGRPDEIGPVVALESRVRLSSMNRS